MFVPQRGILVSAGGSHRPCGCPAPIRRARRARKWVHGLVGLRRGSQTPRAHREERAEGVRRAPARALRARRGILMGVGGRREPRAPPAPARRAQRARADAPRASKGLWCGARCDTAECDPRADGARACPDVRRRYTCYYKTHPDTPDTLGARVVAVLGPLVSRWPPRGGIQRNARIEPLVERAETTQRAWVALLSTWGVSVGYQGGRNARIPILRRPPDLPLQYPVHAGHVASRAARLTLRKTRTHSRPLWRRRTRWWCQSRIVQRS